MTEVGDMLTARIVGTISGQPIINNLSFTAVTAFGVWSEAASQLADDLIGAVALDTTAGLFMDQRSAQYALSELQIIDVSPGVAPLYSRTLSAVGNQAGDCLPPNDSLAVTLRSNFKGPSGRGRIYLAGYPEAGQVNGFWQADPQSNADQIGGALDDAFGELAGAANFRWCVLHRVSGGVPLVPPEVKPIFGWTVHNEVRSLGRRAMGRKIRRRSVGP
jgi:hypothetical protein